MAAKLTSNLLSVRVSYSLKHTFTPSEHYCLSLILKFIKGILWHVDFNVYIISNLLAEYARTVFLFSKTFSLRSEVNLSF